MFNKWAEAVEARDRPAADPRIGVHVAGIRVTTDIAEIVKTTIVTG